MNLIYETDQAQGLEELTSLFHDCWFNLDLVEFDTITRTVNVPFEVTDDGQWKRLISFENAKAVNIVDTEKIGTYDFNEINLNKTCDMISISSGIPLVFEIYVDDLIVKVYER